MWIIKRRFSDVMWIYETFSVNHLGYIIPFFPSSTLESFFTAKVGCETFSWGFPSGRIRKMI